MNPKKKILDKIPYKSISAAEKTFHVHRNFSWPPLLSSAHKERILDPNDVGH